MGIGGIGMSALARYFNTKGFAVGGYDRSKTKLTSDLETEGISICYNESVNYIPAEFVKPESTLIVLTPAVPESQK